MIYPETKLYTSDNSGAKIVKCIKVLKSSKHFGARPGHIVIFSIRKLKILKKITKGEIHRGVFIRGKKIIQRENGLNIKFSDNSLVLVNEKNIPLGSRIFGPMYKELKELGHYPKVVSLAKNLL